MVQQGQVFKLKTKGEDGKPLWAYRYRLQGRGSGRRQVGGFATQTEAQRALRKALDRLLPGGRTATLTLAEFVDEYLHAHPGLPVTVSKLRWLLGKATAALGEVRLIDLTPEQVCSWRMTIPEGHRYEATQALRQVLNRAVAWELLDSNPAKRGVPNPLRRSLEKRPFETWQQIEAVAAQLGPVHGPMVVFAAATGLRPAELFALEHRDLDFKEGAVYVRRAYANGRVWHVKTRRSMRGCLCKGSRSRPCGGCRRTRARSCSRTRAAATSTSTTSASATGGRRSSKPASSRSGSPMTCVTPTRPSRFAPASQPSRSPATWGRAWR